MKRSTADDGYRKFKQYSLSHLVETEPDLASLRKKYASKSAEKRRMAADWEYHSAMASDLFETAIARTGQTGLGRPYWPPGIVALVVDPQYAPALLTVGTLEYQCGRIKEAINLFRKLAELPKDEKDLPEIIDEAADFLIDQKDYKNALELYLAAERLDPEQSTYFVGSGYCLGKLSRFKESIEKHRQAVALEPTNYKYLNDLGFTLLEAGAIEEAEKVLKKSESLAPSDYKFPTNNLKELYERKRRVSKQKTGGTL